jgi:glutathione S-transferase
MGIIVYDLAGIDDRRFSPYCWRTKFALAHKGLAFEARPLAFTEIPAACGGGHATVPILQDGERIVGDSWAIADYLDAAYPDKPRLFATPTERALCRFHEAWLFPSLILPLILPIYVKDIHDHVQEKDRAYFRQSREKRFGRTLEEMSAGREAKLDAARASLEPVRMTLTRQGQAFMSGDKPGYADYITAGALLWVASVATLPLLKEDDPVVGWFERVRDLYDGLGRRWPTNRIVG